MVLPIPGLVRSMKPSSSKARSYPWNQQCPMHAKCSDRNILPYSAQQQHDVMTRVDSRSEAANVLGWSKAYGVSFRGSLLILFVQLDGLVSFCTDQAGARLVECHGKDPRLALKRAWLHLSSVLLEAVPALPVPKPAPPHGTFSNTSHPQAGTCCMVLLPLYRLHRGGSIMLKVAHVWSV